MTGNSDTLYLGIIMTKKAITIISRLIWDYRIGADEFMALLDGEIKHRYSDDLDFFVNDDGRFAQDKIAVYSALKRAGIVLDLLIDEIRFKRIMADRLLKIEKERP